MVDVDCAVGAAPCLTPADDSGYEIDEAEVIYWGLCPECLAKIPVPPGAEGKNVPDRRVAHRDDDRATARDQTDD